MEYKVLFFWLICNLLSIAILAFYSMLEMACVSFNKVRLQYYVSKGSKRAIWLNYLLQHPSRLFGTTLIGVNISLVIGSECAREFFSSLGLSPELAPLPQSILVVIFGELSPMFAARRYAENTAMLGVPLIYASSKLMAPLLWILGLISKVCNFLIGGKEAAASYYVTQEELQHILEEKSEETATERESKEFSAVATNIFSLRGKAISKIMEPLSTATSLPSNATIAHMESLISKSGVNYVPIYNREISNIVGIAYPKDALRAPETRRVRDYAQAPWFVTENTDIMQILKQFRSNNECVAIILNQQGKAIGLVDLNDIFEEVFGKIILPPVEQAKQIMLIEKSFSGETTVAEFNAQFGVMLDKDPSLTLSDLMIAHLGHRPEKGDSIHVGQFEITAKEITLLEVKTVSISTIRG